MHMIRAHVVSWISGIFVFFSLLFSFPFFVFPGMGLFLSLPPSLPVLDLLPLTLILRHTVTSTTTTITITPITTAFDHRHRVGNYRGKRENRRAETETNRTGQGGAGRQALIGTGHRHIGIGSVRHKGQRGKMEWGNRNRGVSRVVVRFFIQVAVLR